jgi:hypothetical protein
MRMLTQTIPVNIDGTQPTTTAAAATRSQCLTQRSEKVLRWWQLTVICRCRTM